MDIIITIFSLIILLFSVIIHELAHGYVANSLGDPTAKYEGRLTLNPIKHLDPFGSIILPLLLFLAGSPILVGWAKPVPINPYNFKDQKWGSLKVAIAGPISNIILAVFFGLIIRFASAGFIMSYPGFFIILTYIVIINLTLAIFNLLPIPPLDGSWILFRFLPGKLDSLKFFLHRYGIFILIIFLVFNVLYFLGIFQEVISHFIMGDNWFVAMRLLT